MTSQQNEITFTSEQVIKYTDKTFKEIVEPFVKLMYRKGELLPSDSTGERWKYRNLVATTQEDKRKFVKITQEKRDGIIGILRDKNLVYLLEIIPEMFKIMVNSFDEDFTSQWKRFQEQKQKEINESKQMEQTRSSVSTNNSQDVNSIYYEPEKQIDILREQLVKLSKKPLQYFPFEVAKRNVELNPDDEWLQDCLSIHPDYQTYVREIIANQWDTDIDAFSEKCYNYLRKIVPYNVNDIRLEDLIMMRYPMKLSQDMNKNRKLLSLLFLRDKPALLAYLNGRNISELPITDLGSKITPIIYAAVCHVLKMYSIGPNDIQQKPDRDKKITLLNNIMNGASLCVKKMKSTGKLLDIPLSVCIIPEEPPQLIPPKKFGNKDYQQQKIEYDATMNSLKPEIDAYKSALEKVDTIFPYCLQAPENIPQVYTGYESSEKVTKMPGTGRREGGSIKFKKQRKTKRTKKIRR